MAHGHRMVHMHSWCSMIVCLLLICHLLVSSSSVSAYHLEMSQQGNHILVDVTVAFPQPVVTERQVNGEVYAEISMTECFSSGAAGEPALPVYAAHILLPQRGQVEDITVNAASFETLAYDFSSTPILPQQELYPFSEMPSSDEFLKNEAVYASSQPSMDELFEDEGIGYCKGYRILTLALHPVQYRPQQGRVSATSSMDITITVSLSDLQPYSNRSFYREKPEDKEFLASLVENSDDIEEYSLFGILPLGDGEGDDGQGGEGGGDFSPLGNDYPGGLCDPADTYEYVIVTTDELSDTNGYDYEWSDLLAHRASMNGLSGCIVTMEEIIACTDYWNETAVFNDSQARLREFCKDAYLDWGMEYLVLGGDWDDGDASRQIVPYRLFEDRLEYETYDTMPCDMYYNHLDGDWYFESQSMWGGGRASGVNDPYAEFSIGRLPVYNAEHISNIITKILWYETSAPDDWLKKAAFCGGELGWSVTSKEYMEEIRVGDGSFSENVGFEEWNTANPSYEIDTSCRLYDADYPTESAYLQALKDAINNNEISMMNHLDHGSPTTALGLTHYSLRAFTNTRLFIAYSAACLSGRFNTGTTAEFMLTVEDADHRAFAVMFNTGYGYGSTTSTYGPSQQLQKIFWDYFFNASSSHSDTWQLGRAQAYSKDKFSALVDSLGKHHSWCYIWYSNHLFADPALTLSIGEEIEVNQAPSLSDEDPSDDATDVSVDTSSVSVTISDGDSDSFDWTIETSPDVGSASGDDETDGVKTCSLSGLSYETIYTWFVNVTDGTEWTRASYQFTTEEEPIVNMAPVVSNPSPTNASTDIAISTSQGSITIEDPDGDTFDWSIETSPDIGSTSGDDDTNGTKTCSISNLAYETTYSWFVNVTDGTEWTRRYYVFTTEDAPAPNHAPVVSDPSPANGSTGVVITSDCLEITIEDADGDSFDWTIETSPDVGSGSGDDASNGTKSCSVSGLGYATVYTWFVNVTDGEDSVHAYYTFTSEDAPVPNTAPVASSPAPANGSAAVAVSTTQVSLSIEDADGDTFDWTIETSPDIGDASGADESNGTKICSVSGLTYATEYTWFVNVSDGEDWTRVYYVFTTEDEPVGNSAPIVSIPSPANASTDVSISLDSLSVLIQDPNGDTFDWTIETSPNVGSSDGSSASNGSKTCSLSTLAYETTYTWYVNATDGEDWVRAYFVFTTEAEPVPNTPPQLTSPSPSNNSIDVTIETTTVEISIEDDDGSIDWTIETSPAIGDDSGSDEANGTKSCSVSGLAYATTYTWYVNATDGEDWTRAYYVFTTEDVPAINNPPVVSSPSPTNTSTDIAVSTSQVSITIEDPDGDSFDWTIETSPDIGSISGDDDTNGSKTCSISSLTYDIIYTWFVNVTDGENWTRAYYLFTTEPMPEENQPPVLSIPSPSNGSSSVAIDTSQVSITIEDPEGDSFNWTIETIPNIGNASNTTTSNGSKTCSISDLAYATSYLWYVNATDGSNWTRHYYTFTTEDEPDDDPLPGGGGYNPPPAGDDDDDDDDDDTNETSEENHPPATPDDIIGPDQGQPNTLYEFTTSSYDVDDDRLRFRFDWGDDTFSSWSAYVNSNTTVTMSHQWSSTGIYEIKVIAQDENSTNSSWSASHTIEILENQTVPITQETNTTTSDTNTTTNSTIPFTFADEITIPAGVVSYEWDFGDGNTGSGKYPTHRYTKPGTYKVILTMTDEDGNVYEEIRYITVEGAATSAETVTLSFDMTYLLLGILLSCSIIGILLFIHCRRGGTHLLPLHRLQVFLYQHRRK